MEQGALVTSPFRPTSGKTRPRIGECLHDI